MVSFGQKICFQMQDSDETVNILVSNVNNFLVGKRYAILFFTNGSTLLLGIDFQEKLYKQNFNGFNLLIENIQITFSSSLFFFQKEKEIIVPNKFEFRLDQNFTTTDGLTTGSNSSSQNATLGFIIGIVIGGLILLIIIALIIFILFYYSKKKKWFYRLTPEN